jgi:hypothetical protein
MTESESVVLPITPFPNASRKTSETLAQPTCDLDTISVALVVQGGQAAKPNDASDRHRPGFQQHPV